MTFVLNPDLYKPLPSTDAEAQRVTAARARIRANAQSGEASTEADIAIARQYQYASEAERDAARGGAAAERPAATGGERGNGPFDEDAATAAASGPARQTGEVVGGAVGAVVNGTGAAAGAVVDAVRDPQGAVDDAGDAAGRAGRNFMDNLNAGSITGAVIGGAGAFLISSMFGGGPLKWLFFALLAPAGFILGSGRMGEPINRMFSNIFGGGRNRENGGDTPERGAAPDTPARGEGPQTPASQTPTLTGPNDWRFRPLDREELRYAQDIRAAVPQSVASTTHYAPETPAERSVQYFHADGTPMNPSEAVYFGGRAAEGRRDEGPSMGARGFDSGGGSEDGRVRVRDNGDISVHGAGISGGIDRNGRVRYNLR